MRERVIYLWPKGMTIEVSKLIVEYAPEVEIHWGVGFHRIEHGEKPGTSRLWIRGRSIRVRPSWSGRPDVGIGSGVSGFVGPRCAGGAGAARAKDVMKAPRFETARAGCSRDEKGGRFTRGAFRERPGDRIARRLAAPRRRRGLVARWLWYHPDQSVCVLRGKVMAVQAWRDWYHCMVGTYGQWLPGDEPRVA